MHMKLFETEDDPTNFVKGSLASEYTSHDAVWDFAHILTQTKTGRSSKRLIEQMQLDLWSGPAQSPVAEKITGKQRRAPTSTALVGSTQSIGSAEYFATVRRRLVNGLLPLVSDLQAWADSDLFVVRTRTIVEGLREALRTLEMAKSEGNCRAILRQLRDTFLNSGWDQWREAKKRDAGLAVMRVLLKEGQLSAADVDQCFDRLLDAGLTPVALPVVDFGEDTEYHVKPDVSG